MGFLDKLNEMQSSKSSEEIENNENKQFNLTIQKYNLFEGVEVEATFPQRELKIKTHNGATRGLATLGFGLVGLAATSSVKSSKENVVMDTTIQIVEKGIVFKNAKDDGGDLRIPYENIIRAERTTKKFALNDKLCLFTWECKILMLENQEINLYFRKLSSSSRKHVSQHLIDVINERAEGSQYEEDGWGLEHAIGNQLIKEENPQTESSDVNELEKIMKMYEKGLLTDEEFIAMKKKIIER